MASISCQNHECPPGSPVAAVQEIDTRVPFDSVRAAVTLFGQVAVSNQEPSLRTSTFYSKTMIDKERQLVLARKELNDVKQKLERARSVEANALAEHERGKQTLQDLTKKVKRVIYTTQEAIAAKQDAKRLETELSRKLAEMRAQKREVDVAREQAKASVAELNAAKQELDKIRQDFDAALEEKTAAFQQAAEAWHWFNVQSEKAYEISADIAAMREGLEGLKSAGEKAENEEKDMERKQDALREAYQAAKAESDKKLEVLKKEYDPELTENLQAALLGKAADSEVLQEEMKKICTWRVASMELNEATWALQQLTDEEWYMRKLLSTLNLQLEAVRKEQAEIREQEAVKEVTAKQNELIQLLSETENTRHETEEINRTIETLKREAESARVAEEETSRKLEVALREAKEATTAKNKAFDKVRAIRKRQ